MAKIKKMQAGGTAKPAKRVGPVDPNGAYTKVQERTIAGAKAPNVPLVKDKELGATVMKKGGSVKKMQIGGKVGNYASTKENIDKGFSKRSIKSETGNYKAKIKVGEDGKPEITERRTIKGFLKGAPKATGKMELKKGGSVAKDGKWIQKAIKKPGALRSALGAKKGQPIPAGKLAKAAKAKGKLGQRARLAMTLKRMSKKK